MSKNYTIVERINMLDVLANFPLGDNKGRSHEYYAAKANIVALFMERELGIPQKETEKKLCHAVGIETLGMRSAEMVLGLRTGATMDYSTCQLAIDHNQEYFKNLKTLVVSL